MVRHLEFRKQSSGIRKPALNFLWTPSSTRCVETVQVIRDYIGPTTAILARLGTSPSSPVTEAGETHVLSTSEICIREVFPHHTLWLAYNERQARPLYPCLSDQID